jgi:hypothetical protein
MLRLERYSQELTSSICTFKVRNEFQGEKFRELILKQVLWFAQRNKRDLIYVTAFPMHSSSIYCPTMDSK